MHRSDIPADSLAVLRTGSVIPAHLLALDENRQLDVRRQRAMTRYYLDAGAGGVAVGVHSTQFAIRDYQEISATACWIEERECRQLVVQRLQSRFASARFFKLNAQVIHE